MEGSDVAVRAKKHKKRKGKKQKHRSERCVRTCAPLVHVTFFLSCCTCSSRELQDSTELCSGTEAFSVSTLQVPRSRHVCVCVCACMCMYLNVRMY